MDDKDLLIQAESLRRSWGMDNVTPLNIFSIALEKVDDLTLLWFPMNNMLNGCCSKTKVDKIICINSNFSKGAQNFTLAHELYHVLFNDENDVFACSTNSKDTEEKRADRFASYLLMPAIALNEFQQKNDIDDWNLKDIIRCEQYFQVSHNAMLVRLECENMISKREMREYKKDVLGHALNLGYGSELYEKSKREYFTMGKIISLTEFAWENDRISSSKRDSILLNVFRGDIAYNMFEGEYGIDL